MGEQDVYQRKRYGDPEQPDMNLYEIELLFNKVFNAKNFLYSTGLYHLIGVLFFVYGITGFHLQTLVAIDENLIRSSYGLSEVILEHKKIGAILNLSAVLVFFDLIFLCMISYDFRWLKLTMKKIGVLEVLVFILSMMYPLFRGAMLFFSLNTLVMFFFYHASTFFSGYDFHLPRYVIVMGGYIWLAKIIMYSIVGLGVA